MSSRHPRHPEAHVCDADDWKRYAVIGHFGRDILCCSTRAFTGGALRALKLVVDAEFDR